MSTILSVRILFTSNQAMFIPFSRIHFFALFSAVLLWLPSGMNAPRSSLCLFISEK